MRGLNLKEIMSKSNMNQQGLNIATYGQAYAKESNELNIKTNDTAQKIVISKVFRYLILYLIIEH